MTETTGGSSFAPSADLDIRYYLGLIWRQRLIPVTTVVVGLMLGSLVAFLQVPEYRASVMVQIDPPTPLFMTVNDALMGSGFWQNADYYNTQFKILRSRALGDEVVKRLKLTDRPPFKDNPDPGTLFVGQVSVEPIPESRLVLVQVTHEDPREAALWANTLADVYLEYSVSSRVDSARRAYDWLQEQLVSTRGSMQQTQEKLLNSYREQDLFVPEGGISSVVTSISRLTEDFISAQSRRIALEAALKQIQDVRARGESLDSVPQMAADAALSELNARIAAGEADLARLREKYRPAYPDVQRATAALETLKENKQKRTDLIIEGMRAELSQIQKKEDELKVAIDAQKAQAAQQSRKATELEALRKESESTKGIYDVLLQKLHESDIAASIRSNNTSIIERATAPRAPVRPDRRRIAGSWALAGLLLGVAVVLGRDFFQNTIKDPDDVERFLHVDLLAAVPRYDENSVHLVTEAYQNLRTAMIFGRKDDQGQVVLVTGTAPQEGKTTTLVNIGKLLASSGEKTLLLDCDLRRAQLHSRLSLQREPGFTDYFIRHENVDRMVQATHVPNLFVLASGPLPPNPPALLARKSLLDLLGELRRHFDWILVDSPPLASVTDALLLARYADLVVFVIEYNKVDKMVLRRNVAAIQKVTPNLLGAVLNAVDVKAKGYYYYYYHQDARTKGEESGENGQGRPAAHQAKPESGASV